MWLRLHHNRLVWIGAKGTVSLTAALCFMLLYAAYVGVVLALEWRARQQRATESRHAPVEMGGVMSAFWHDAAPAVDHWASARTPFRPKMVAPRLSIFQSMKK